jgi:hypothetical protein
MFFNEILPKEFLLIFHNNKECIAKQCIDWLNGFKFYVAKTKERITVHQKEENI